MKKILLATTVMAATACVATASTSFNGFYLGAQAGGVISKAKNQITSVQLASAGATSSLSTTYKKSSDGFLFGTYFGYGRNLNSFYVGGELSILGDTATRTVKGSAANSTGVYTYSTNTKYKRGIAFGFSPRLGYIFGENLIYVKPGFEISRDKIISNKNVTASSVTTVDPQWSNSKTAIVFTPAFGYERAIGKVLVRAEYTYNAGKKIALSDSASSITQTGNVSYSDNRFIVGAAYKF